MHSLLKTVFHPSSSIFPLFLKCPGRANCSSNCFLAVVSISPSALFDAPRNDHLFLPSSEEMNIIRKAQSNHVLLYKRKKIKQKIGIPCNKILFCKCCKIAFSSLHPSCRHLNPSYPGADDPSNPLHSLCPPTSSSNNWHHTGVPVIINPCHFLKQLIF